MTFLDSSSLGKGKNIEGVGMEVDRQAQEIYKNERQNKTNQNCSLKNFGNSLLTTQVSIQMTVMGSKHRRT